MAKYIGGYVPLDDVNEIDTSKSLGELFTEEYDRMIAKDIADVIEKHTGRIIDEDKVLKLAQMVLADDVAPVKHARWYDGRCTNCCHEALDYLADDEGGCYMKTYITKYCPNCGAKMDGGKE